MKFIIKKIVVLASVIGSPITVLASVWLKIMVKFGVGNVSNKIFMWIGVLPVLDHYYQPLINPKKYLKKSLREDRKLPGLDLNVEEQLHVLNKFNYNDELLRFPIEKTDQKNEFYYNNRSYASGDAEYLYNIIRHFKPERVVEIGSGNSTLMAQNAIKQNKVENSKYTCDHICIEPYEMPWLKELDIELIRSLAEDLPYSFFDKLQKNDILFIDSSHIIRPQGDVLFEFLELLPKLNSGVLVHVHYIFTPKDYLDSWVIKEHKMWNEQYILEAFLTFNSEFRIIGALNYLSHHHRESFSSKCPVFAKQEQREPGAFWLIKN